MPSLTVLLAVLATSAACLITNCPRGGKRSGSGPEPGTGFQSCLRCGPAGEGLCVGPGICCAPRSGCLLAPRGPCARAPAPSEALPPRCLRAPAQPCGAELTPDGSAPGRCAAQGVCCTHDSCRLDAICFQPDDNDLMTGPEDVSQMTLRMAS